MRNEWTVCVCTVARACPRAIVMHAMCAWALYQGDNVPDIIPMGAPPSGSEYMAVATRGGAVECVHQAGAAPGAWHV